MQTDTSYTNRYADTLIQHIPFNFIRSGFYYYNNGISVNNRNNAGYYWELQAASATEVKNLGLRYDYITIGYNPNINRKGTGFTVRCLVPLEFSWFTGNSLPTMVLKAIRTYWLRCMEDK